MKKPIIGILLDKEVKGDYSDYPYFVLREHYFDAIYKAGGLPVALPIVAEAVDEFIDVVDGLLLPGGDYDIPPGFYGETEIHDTVVTKEDRLDFDCAVTQKFLDADKPILGICLGEQLLAAMHGGTLIQDIPTEIGSAINHYENLRAEAAHEIIIEEGTILHNIVGIKTLGINSHHHQAVKEVSDKLVVSAKSPDGVIEAIEVKGQKFCIGLQWHPEYLNTPEELKIFKAFISACQK